MTPNLRIVDSSYEQDLDHFISAVDVLTFVFGLALTVLCSWFICVGLGLL
jgi:hypothetical protein